MAGQTWSGKRDTEIRDAISRLGLRYDGDSMGRITVSIGISIYPEPGETPVELMKKADQALYKAKESGRDCIIFAERSEKVPDIRRIKLRR